MTEKLDEGFRYLITKLIIPAIVVITVKLAFIAQKMKLSKVVVVTNLVMGVGTVYLCSDLLIMYFNPHLLTVMSALIAMSSEKICHYLIYKFKIDAFISAFINTMIDKLRK